MSLQMNNVNGIDFTNKSLIANLITLSFQHITMHTRSKVVGIQIA